MIYYESQLLFLLGRKVLKVYNIQNLQKTHITELDKFI